MQGITIYGNVLLILIIYLGDRVWKKNYVLSNAPNHFAAKLAPKFVLCTVKRIISPLVYQLVGPDGKDVGKHHVKDLKPYHESEDVVDDDN